MRSLFPITVLCFAACPTPVVLDETPSPVNEPPPLDITDPPPDDPVDLPPDDPVDPPPDDPVDPPPDDPVDPPPDDPVDPPPPVEFTAAETNLVDGRLCDLAFDDAANP